MRTLYLLFALIAASSQDREPFASNEVVPFLRIDETEVSLDEFGRWLLEIEGEHQASEFARKSWVIDRAADRLGLQIADEVVEGEIEGQIRERITGAFRGDREEWIAELHRTGRTEEGIRRQRFVEARPEIQARAIASLDRVVPEHLIRREWELRHGRKGRRYDLRMMRFQVVVPSRPDMGRDEWNAGRQEAMEEARLRALAARERVVGGEDFGLVASRESDDPETRDRRGVPKGGFRDVGWTKSMHAVLEELSPGDISPPIYARGGWWIVEVRSVHTTPLESVRREIEADLVARGPEPYEIGLLQDRLAEGMQVKVLPTLFDAPAAEEWPGAREPVILIDGEPVTRGEYARWLFDAIGETRIDPFTEEWLLRRKAHEAGVEVSQADVEGRTQEYIAALVDRGYHGDRDAWIAYLEMGGRSEEAFVRRIARRMQIELLTERLYLRDRVVRPEDVRARFAGAFGTDGLRREVRMILFQIQLPELPSGLTREELQTRMSEASDATRQRAQGIVERVRGGEDFAATARAVSDDPRTREQGGALPDRFRSDQWSESIVKAVGALRPSEITDPLLYGNAWIVFQLASERRVSFEEVEKELERELRAARPGPTELAGYRNELLKRARVERQPVSGR